VATAASATPHPARARGRRAGAVLPPSPRDAPIGKLSVGHELDDFVRGEIVQLIEGKKQKFEDFCFCRRQAFSASCW